MEVEPPCTQETLASSTRVLAGLPSGVAHVLGICASISREHIENELFSPMYKLFIAHLTYFAREKVYVADSCDRADFNRDPICTHSTRVHHGLGPSGHASCVHKPRIH